MAGGRADEPPPRRSRGERDVVGDAYMAVAGESHHRSAITRLMEPKRTGRAVFPMVVLRPERGNRSDRNAVAVVVDHQRVGYLPRDVAAEFADAFAGGDLRCSAEIRRQRMDHDWNVVLRVDYARLRALRDASRAAERSQSLSPMLDAISEAALAHLEALDDGSPEAVVSNLRAERDRLIVLARTSDPRPTAAEVAEAAGISATTVGRIVNASTQDT